MAKMGRPAKIQADDATHLVAIVESDHTATLTIGTAAAGGGTANVTTNGSVAVNSGAAVTTNTLALLALIRMF